MDVTKLGKIPDGGRRKAHGRAAASKTRDRRKRVGFDYVRSIVEDHTHLAELIDRIGATHKFIRPHCSWQNGKVERFNRTLQTEWAYRQIFVSNDTRASKLATRSSCSAGCRDHRDASSSSATRGWSGPPQHSIPDFEKRSP